ncbi:MAG: MFS transporter [Anaerolineales bacterium]|nr:MFS transporter [Anaerolineales bacterium]
MATQFSVKDNISWKGRFFTIFSGQAFSLLGSMLVEFALIWYLTVTTESATVLAVASMVGMLPRVVIGPFIGPLVDRWNRRKTLIVADSVVAFATLVLALLFAFTEVPIWQIYVILFVRAVAGAFHGTTMSASNSLMVPTEHLARIQGINQMLNGGLNVISAPLGAILYEVLALQWILAIDFITAIVAIIPLFFFQIPQPDGSTSQGLSGQASTYFQDLAAGFRYVWAWKGLLGLLLMAAMINFLLSPTFSLLPLMIKDYFGGGAIELGTFESVVGIGIIVGGLLLGVWGGFKRQILTSLSGILLLGSGVLVTGLIPNDMFVLAIVTAGFMGLSLPVANGSLGAIMQKSVAPEMQGRVFALTGSIAGAMSPIGLAIAGPVADLLSIQAWFIIAGCFTIGMAVAGRLLPAVWNIENNNTNGEVENPVPATPIPEAAMD